MTASTPAKRRIVFQWPISSYFGWGVYGLNLALNGTSRALSLVSATPFLDERVTIDPIRAWALREFAVASRGLTENLLPHAGKVIGADCMVLHALGNRLEFAALAAHNAVITGNPTIGVIFFEDTDLGDNAVNRARDYRLIIAGSTWNAEVMKAQGIENVAVSLQGVDTTQFHPAPRAGFLEARGRFAIFSGGKLEYRKGQDLVLKAFKVFQQRHPEAVLVTAWHSPWSVGVAGGLTEQAGLAPLRTRENGSVDSVAWAVDNGIPAESVVDLGALPNALMPTILREMDAAVFPNRAEGGTNLVAMETMACGIPTILSANTGHLDLIGDDNCYRLDHQGAVVPVGVNGTEGWGESSIDEILGHLETIYQDRATARKRGFKGAETLLGLSWSNQIAHLLKTLEPHHADAGAAA